MNFLNNLWTTDVQDLGDVLLVEPIPLEIELAGLEIGAHAAVEDDDTLAN